MMKAFYKRISLKYSAAAAATMLITAISQYSFGRILICKCGYIKFWHGVTWSSENSQHLTDWYTFSHIIHGFAFYYLGKLFKKLSLFKSFVLACILEAGWEIWENTDFIINRYRETTISLDYYGDSIINSAFDILAMMLGFWLAAKLPLRWVLLLTLVMELFTGYWIRDNLALNILMLIYPFETVKTWQLGG